MAAMTTSRSKAAGSAAERVVAAALAGRRVGHEGGPVDVIVDGYLDVQVKAVKTLPSLAAVIGYLEAIPRSDRLRSCVVVTRPGSGKRAVRTITFDLDEFALWHGSEGTVPEHGLTAWPVGMPSVADFIEMGPERTAEWHAKSGIDARVTKAIGEAER